MKEFSFWKRWHSKDSRTQLSLSLSLSLSLFNKFFWVFAWRKESKRVLLKTCQFLSLETSCDLLNHFTILDCDGLNLLIGFSDEGIFILKTVTLERIKNAALSLSLFNKFLWVFGCSWKHVHLSLPLSLSLSLSRERERERPAVIFWIAFWFFYAKENFTTKKNQELLFFIPLVCLGAMDKRCLADSVWADQENTAQGVLVDVGSAHQEVSHRWVLALEVLHAFHQTSGELAWSDRGAALWYLIAEVRNMMAFGTSRVGRSTVLAFFTKPKTIATHKQNTTNLKYSVSVLCVQRKDKINLFHTCSSRRYQFASDHQKISRDFYL